MRAQRRVHNPSGDALKAADEWPRLMEVVARMVRDIAMLVPDTMTFLPETTDFDLRACLCWYAPHVRVTAEVSMMKIVISTMTQLSAHATHSFQRSFFSGDGFQNTSLIGEIQSELADQLASACAPAN